MKKNQIHKIIIHTEQADLTSLPARIGKFHTKIIQNRLSAANLSTRQKIKIVQQIIENLQKDHA